jgi:hypothetical protein
MPSVPIPRPRVKQTSTTTGTGDVYAQPVLNAPLAIPMPVLLAYDGAIESGTSAAAVGGGKTKVLCVTNLPPGLTLTDLANL